MAIFSTTIEELPTTGTLNPLTQGVITRVQTAEPMANRAMRLSLLLVLLVYLTLAGCDSRKNVCPIDGQPPEGLGQRNGQSCEYFHYSVIEKKTHSWWAECVPDGMQ